jgi:hypothetical protein
MKTEFRALFAGVAAISLLTIGHAAHAQDKTIKIGALFPMSGPGSYFGAQDKQGVELALEQLNKSGVNGYKFAVQYEDSSCGPLPATQAAKRLIEQFKPDVIIGEECSDATLAVMPIVDQAKVPLLNAGSSSIKVTEPGNSWTFRIMPNEVMQGINLADNAYSGSTHAMPSSYSKTPTPALAMHRCSRTPSPSLAVKSSRKSALAVTSTTSPRSRRGSPVSGR